MDKKITFHSVDSDGEKVIFHTEGTIIDNKIVFVDKTAKNTNIIITLFNDCVAFERIGESKMYLKLALNTYTKCNYDNHGLAFEFEAYTTKLNVTNTKLEFEYDMYIEKDLISKRKIYILLH